MKLVVLACFLSTVSAIKYMVSVKTATADWADSNGWFYAAALGYNGNMIDFGVMGKDK